jgi:hypothetical protein
LFLHLSYTSSVWMVQTTHMLAAGTGKDEVWRRIVGASVALNQLVSSERRWISKIVHETVRFWLQVLSVVLWSCEEKEVLHFSV